MTKAKDEKYNQADHGESYLKIALNTKGVVTGEWKIRVPVGMTPEEEIAFLEIREGIYEAVFLQRKKEIEAKISAGEY